MSLLTTIEKEGKIIVLDLEKVLAWFKKEYVVVEPIVLAVMVEVETAIQNGSVQKLVDVLSVASPQFASYATGVVEILKLKLPYYMADITALENFPANPTPADIQNLATTLIATFPKLTANVQDQKNINTAVSLAMELDTFYGTVGTKTFMDYINEFLKLKGIIAG